MKNQENFSPKDFYKPLFESAVEGILLANKEGQILLVNPKLEELFLYDKDELIGKNVKILIPEKNKKNHDKHVNGYFKNSKPRAMGNGMILYGKCKNGVEIPIEIGLNYFENKGEKFAIALITNISERLAIQQQVNNLNENLELKVKERTVQLQESERRYNLISRNFPEGTINVLDKSLNYLFVEGKELFKLGITSEKLIGSNYISRLPKKTAEDVRIKLNQALNGQSTSIQIKLKENFYELDAVPLDIIDGKIQNILVIEKNITDKKITENNIKEALEKEKELNNLKSRFVSMASHEFRTPLTTILSSNSLISKYPKENQQENRLKHIKRINNTVHHLNSILDDFLSIDKIEEGKINAELIEFNLKEKIEDIIDSMQGYLKINQKININYSGENQVKSDKKIISNILVNLISNASKYSNENCPIDIEVRVNESTFVIKIKDHGIGIPLDEQKHMFERFYRANNVTNIQGTGLGLNITKKFILLLNGTITFDSTPNSGTEFIIEIPYN